MKTTLVRLFVLASFVAPVVSLAQHIPPGCTYRNPKPQCLPDLHASIVPFALASVLSIR